jgi:hypothetical protein
VNISGERSAAPLKKKGLHIQPPFPWSTEYRAKNYSLEWILHLGITSIRGEVQCKRCDGMTTVEVSLEDIDFDFVNMGVVGQSGND